MTPGNVVIRTIHDGDARRYEVLEADPLIEISQEMLESELNRDLVVLDGDVLTIDGCNRRVVYRILRDTYDPFKRTFLAEWPD